MVIAGRSVHLTKFSPVKVNSYPEISVQSLFKFELHVDSFCPLFKLTKCC